MDKEEGAPAGTPSFFNELFASSLAAASISVNYYPL
jgi:hypothetical protein